MCWSPGEEKRCRPDRRGRTAWAGGRASLGPRPPMSQKWCLGLGGVVCGSGFDAGSDFDSDWAPHTSDGPRAPAPERPAPHTDYSNSPAAGHRTCRTDRSIPRPRPRGPHRGLCSDPHTRAWYFHTGQRSHHADRCAISLGETCETPPRKPAHPPPSRP